MSDIDDKKKKLAKGCSVYRLEIAYNKEEGTKKITYWTNSRRCEIVAA